MDANVLSLIVINANTCTTEMASDYIILSPDPPHHTPYGQGVE